MSDAYIGLGSNVGDSRLTLRAAVAALGDLGDVVAVSPLYETDPVGLRDQPVFLNAVARLRTSRGPHRLLDGLHDIEQRMGRVRTVRFGPRTLDLDLLLYGDSRLDSPRLTLPHPRMTEREFVLRPLADLAPEVVIDGRTVARWLSDLAPQGVRLAGSLMGD